ncbi:hypothetical protein SRHO_G00341630 [Serrasalmus rhombeus]
MFFFVFLWFTTPCFGGKHVAAAKPALNLARRPPAQHLSTIITTASPPDFSSPATARTTSATTQPSSSPAKTQGSPVPRPSSVQSVSVMKATLLVLLLSAVAVMLTCDHQHSEREAGPGCPLGKRLAFDLNTTLEESKRLNNEYFDCPNPEPGAPCFYYSHVRALFFHQMTMTFVQTILICYIGHTCWRLKRKTVYTKTRDGLDEQGN